MEQEYLNGGERPRFERAPDKVNDIGTRFWYIPDFEEIISQLPLEEVKVAFSEYIDPEGEEFWGYLIIEGDDVMFETSSKEDVMEILKTVHQESINRGLIES